MVDPLVALFQPVGAPDLRAGMSHDITSGLQKAFDRFELMTEPKNMTNYEFSEIAITEEDIPFQRVSNLASIVKADIDNLKKIYSFINIIEMNKTTLSDYPAYKIISSYLADGKKIEQMRVYIMANQRIYKIILDSYSSKFTSILPAFEEMVKSFKVDSIFIKGYDRPLRHAIIRNMVV